MNIPRLSLGSITNILTFAVLTAMIAGIIALFLFLHTNLYQPLTEAALISQLKTQVAAVAVKSGQLHQVLGIIEQTREPFIIPTGFRNVFLAPAPSPTPSLPSAKTP